MQNLLLQYDGYHQQLDTLQTSLNKLFMWHADNINSFFDIKEIEDIYEKCILALGAQASIVTELAQLYNRDRKEQMLSR
jgi:hypothetical protein